MKKAEIVEARKPLKLSEAAVPKAPKDGAVVKLLYSGICHSDIHQIDNGFDVGGRFTCLTDNPLYQFPIVPGHEMAGVVHSLGSNAGSAEVKVGDRVAVFPWIGCNKCGYCNNGYTQFCKEKHHTMGFGAVPGGYSNYTTVVHHKFLVKVPASMPLSIATMLPCSGITTYNAVTTALPAIQKATTFKGKASMLIIGAGGLGLWALQIAKSVLPTTTNIVVADISEGKLGNAKDRGADATVAWEPSKSEEQIIKDTSQLGNDDGYDAIIDFVNTGVTSTRAFECLNTDGLQVCVGLFGGAASFPLPVVALSEKGMKGVYVGRLQQLKDLFALVEKNKLTPPPLVYYKLEEINSALDLLRVGKINGRGIIKHEGANEDA
uniref:Enoyl reductase (ER) domain-containing protein n=1 Tax=Ciona savignyi TaxID=51511 RepID=H2ZC39_CIOSA